MIRLASTHLERGRMQMQVASEEMWAAAVEATNLRGDPVAHAAACERISYYDRRLFVAVFRYLVALGAS